MTSGYSDGTFRPTREVTRGEVAKIIYYYLGTSLSRAGKAYTGADLRGDTTNATISESCTLSDATIEGDLFITDEVTGVQRQQRRRIWQYNDIVEEYYRTVACSGEQKTVDS